MDRSVHKRWWRWFAVPPRPVSQCIPLTEPSPRVSFELVIRINTSSATLHRSSATLEFIALMPVKRAEPRWPAAASPAWSRSIGRCVELLSAPFELHINLIQPHGLSSSLVSSYQHCNYRPLSQPSININASSARRSCALARFPIPSLLLPICLGLCNLATPCLQCCHEPRDRGSTPRRLRPTVRHTLSHPHTSPGGQ